LDEKRTCSKRRRPSQQLRQLGDIRDFIPAISALGVELSLSGRRNIEFPHLRLFPIGKRCEAHDAPAHEGTKRSDQQHLKNLVQRRHQPRACTPIRFEWSGGAVWRSTGPPNPLRSLSGQRIQFTASGSLFSPARKRQLKSISRHWRALRTSSGSLGRCRSPQNTEPRAEYALEVPESDAST